ncbi:hypothetical protein BS47DRAFT_260685 [Hydnum rufescens UP504]|uniref:Protein kinase domain-containing protein n=1 Tax=Hydnum rufescens UP504 TaxID=1448309 RepID=A0A9P6E1H7_9AGAM|nr:hypothetical protein BS47DRAFT_260685 [Hydnum rufescens UP504]
MKIIYIEEFMGAIQREMNSYPAKSQTYKLYDERLQQLYQRSKVLPPVNEFDVNDIRRIGNASSTDTRFGPVWKGKTSAGDVVSVKLCSAFNATDKSRQTLYNAVQRWNRLRHPNLQRILGVWYPPNARDSVFSIVSKGIKLGDAIQYISSNPSVDRIHLLLGVALGLKYLHAQGIPHGDLRGNSVLIKDNGDACLTNFGLLGALEEGCGAFVAVALVNLGSVRWMAPEIYDSELIGKERGTVTKETDCHSFGMLILEFLTGQPPFSYIPQDPVVVVELVRGGRPIRPAISPQARQTPSQSLDDSLWSLCEACWAFPPVKRLAAGEIVDSLRVYQHSSRADEARAKSPLLFTTALRSEFTVPTPGFGPVPLRQLSAVDTESLERILDPIPEARVDEDYENFPAVGKSGTERVHDEAPARPVSPPSSHHTQTATPPRAETPRSSGSSQERPVSVPESSVKEFEAEYDPPTQDGPPPLKLASYVCSSSCPLFIV